MRIKIKVALIVTVVAPLLSLASHGANHITLPNPFGNNPANRTLSGFISRLLSEVVVPVGAVVVVIAIIYAGFLFVTAQGNEQKLEKAKKTFLFTVIGAAVLLGASVLADIIRVTINQLR